ncbi:MAG TPA: trypsin-like peptidase domain-containing protein [Gemmataceae bacterium]|nr:trypsin-like peptidase domain-containing protein [Gemmataceae bacterium]
MYRCFKCILACVLVSSPVFADDEGIAEKKLKELKAATVYVRVEGEKGTVTGSGFLIRVDGETGLVATNHHVVSGLRRRFKPQRYQLIFHSGTKRERVLTGEVVASDSGQDLAVLKVTAKDLPAPLDLAQGVKLRETMTVYTFGFPLGERLSSNKSHPAVTIGKGTISSLREDAHGRLQRVQLDGELNPGNSGGPVVTADGQLVGIAVSKIVGTKISFAIPPAELTDILKGRAAAVVPHNLRMDSGSAELEIEVPLLDPLHQLQMVEVRHVRKDTLKEAPHSGPDGSWPDLPGAVKIPVTIEGGKAVAKVTLRAPAKKTFDWLFQAAYTNRSGKSAATQPVALAINFAAEGQVRLDGRTSCLWETITSKEGGFTVDMPVKPSINVSQSRTYRGTTIKMLFLGCHTDDGVYLAFRIDMPIPVPRNQVEHALDAQRDSFAELFEGRVVREKRVMVLSQGLSGRDFTIEGKPDEDETSTIRVRQYLVGRAIFAVVVFSPPDGELPEDAGRFLGSLALGEAKLRANGTPEPEPKGTQLAGWGLAIDPDKDCKFTPESQNLTINVSAAWHDMGGALRKFNAPRVMREVDGDFVLTVKVGGTFDPRAPSTNPKSVPYIAGGILLWNDSANFIRLERAAMRRGNRITSTVAFEEWEGGYSGASHTQTYRQGDCYLRLERRGSRILGAVSSDGRSWKVLKPIDTVWRSKLKVGLMAISTSRQPFAATFEEFELKTKGEQPTK